MFQCCTISRNQEKQQEPLALMRFTHSAAENLLWGVRRDVVLILITRSRSQSPEKLLVCSEPATYHSIIFRAERWCRLQNHPWAPRPTIAEALWHTLICWNHLHGDRAGQRNSWFSPEHDLFCIATLWLSQSHTDNCWVSLKSHVEMPKLTRGLSLKCPCIYCVSGVERAGFELCFSFRRTPRGSARPH